MKTSSYELNLTGKEDVNKISTDLQKSENVHLDLRNNSSISKENFDQLLDCLSKSKQRIFKCDIKDMELDDERVNKLASAMKNWNLYHFNLNMSNVKLSDNQFDSLIEPLKSMNDLEILHLIMENIDMNEHKRQSLQRAIREMKNLRSVHINIRSNKISRDALSDFRHFLEPIPIRQLLWDDDLLF
jgi:hypothetical protein